MRAVYGILQAVAPALLMNVCIVGYNQLCDVAIDKVNKPLLPVASGEFSVGFASAIVVLSGGLSLLLGALSGAQWSWASRARPPPPLPPP